MVKLTKITNKKPIQDQIKTHHMVILYGESGSGKSSVINSLHGSTLIINTDNGLNSIETLGDNSAIADCKSWSDVEETVAYFNDFDNIAVDSMDKVQELALAYVLDKAGVKAGSGKVTFTHYGDSNALVKKFIDNLVYYSNEGKNVLVLCHAKEKKKHRDGDDEDTIVNLNLTPALIDYINAQARVIGYLYRDYKSEIKKGDKKTYVVYKGLFGGSPDIVTKVTRPSSVKAPDVITNVTWDKVMSLMTGIAPKTQEEKGDK